MKILNIILIGIITILLVMSTIALVTIHMNLFTSNFSFTSIGLENYLSSFATYKSLFTGTIATCAAYFGLIRVKATDDSNKAKIKQDEFIEWKTILQARAIEIEWIDPKMFREIIKIRKRMFDSLYVAEFEISDKEQLTTLFNENIKNLVDFFENTNLRHNKLGGIYQNDKTAYSYDSFRFLLHGMIYSYYDEIENDLHSLYLNNLSKNRTIDKGLFETAQRNL